MVRWLIRLPVPLLVALAVLALAAPEVYGQTRMMRMTPKVPTTPRMTPRMTPRNSPSTRAAINRRLDAVEDQLLRRLGFDPFLSRRFGFNPLLGTRSGFNPAFGSMSPGSFGLSGTPASSGVLPVPAFVSAGGTAGQTGSLVEGLEAALLLEEVRAESLANRRAAFDESLYERYQTPTAEEERLRGQREQLSRSLNDPPMNEIWSGKALNDILADLRRRAFADERGVLHTVRLPLDERGLAHINVSRGPGNIALLRNGGRLRWPEALTGAETQGERERLTAEARAAIRQVEAGREVDSSLNRQMTVGVESLDQHLRKNARDLAPARYIEARTFLHNLGDALRALAQDDVRNHFNGRYALTAETVPELVAHMTRQGLHFAPALPEDQAAYTMLHGALAAYDSVVRRDLPPSLAQR